MTGGGSSAMRGLTKTHDPAVEMAGLCINERNPSPPATGDIFPRHHKSPSR